ncbi:MAG TPA: hypothetical protein PKZ42_00610 [Syntrophales bacterium]|nr:hypothetical protein [Syntrophales bacterium]
MSEQEENEFWQNNYSSIAVFPYSWLNKATSLLDAANLALVQESEGPLKGSYRNLDVYMMLTAFAIEDILKAIIFKRFSEIINDNARKKKLFSHHNLSNLARQAQVICTSAEAELLNRLSVAVFGGRYPIPKDWTTYKGQLDGSGSMSPSVWVLPRDFNLIIEFVHKLETELRSLGVNCDLYDMSYSFTKSGEEPVYVARRINPHRLSTVGTRNEKTETEQ